MVPKKILLDGVHEGNKGKHSEAVKLMIEDTLEVHFWVVITAIGVLSDHFVPLGVFVVYSMWCFPTNSILVVKCADISCFLVIYLFIIFTLVSLSFVSVETSFSHYEHLF